jgi:hypothetical protein
MPRWLENLTALGSSVLQNLQRCLQRLYHIVRARQWSLLGALACIAIALWVLLSQGSHVLVEHRNIPITLVISRCRIDSVDVYVIPADRTKTDHDRMHVAVQLSPDEDKSADQNGSTSDSTSYDFTIFYPQNLHGEDTNHYNLKRDPPWVHDGEVVENFRLEANLKPQEKAAMGMDLEGSILSSQARELELELFFQVDGQRNYPPLKVRIDDLEGTTFTPVYPQPSEASTTRIIYSFNDANSLRDIALRLVDRQEEYRAEYRLFMNGIILGVCTSFLASILYEVLRKADHDVSI